MNQPILTTKGTTKNYRIMSLLGGSILIILGYCFVCYSQETWGKTSSRAFMIGLFLWFIAIVLAAVVSVKATSYVEILPDRIIGKGIQKTSAGVKVVDFNLPYNELVNITCDVSNLYINTTHENFQIITTAECAKEIFNYYTQNIRK